MQNYLTRHMVARGPLHYNGREMTAGERFVATPTDGDYFIKHQRAEDDAKAPQATLSAVAPAAPPPPPPPAPELTAQAAAAAAPAPDWSLVVGMQAFTGDATAAASPETSAAAAPAVQEAPTPPAAAPAPPPPDEPAATHAPRRRGRTSSAA